MNLETRKSAFVQEFLKFQSEEVVSYFEQLLLSFKKSKNIDDIQPMSVEELIRRIEQSEIDFENGRFKRSDELLAKYK